MSGFRAKLHATSLTPGVSPEGDPALDLAVSVRNTSDRAWPANGPIFLSYQVLDGAAESLL
ncbi:MAG: hypothetical protein ACREUU_10295, partial [Gammaproteobacteria bacterium]